MDDEHAYMSNFESANMDPSIMEDSAEDSDAAGSSLAASTSGRKGRSNGSNGVPEIGDKRKRAHGSGKRKIAIGEHRVYTSPCPITLLEQQQGIT